MTMALAARTNRIDNRWLRIAVIALIMAIIVPLLILGPGAAPAEAGSTWSCLVNIAGVGAAVVGIYLSSGTAATAASYVGGLSSVIGVFGSCTMTTPYWWGNFPLYKYGKGGGLVKVL